MKKKLLLTLASIALVGGLFGVTSCDNTTSKEPGEKVTSSSGQESSSPSSIIEPSVSSSPIDVEEPSLPDEEVIGTPYSYYEDASKVPSGSYGYYNNPNYYEGNYANVHQAYVDEGIAYFSYTYDNGASTSVDWGCQLFFGNSEIVGGNSYRVEFTLVSSAAGKIIINRVDYNVVEGENKISLTYTYDASDAALDIQFPVAFGNGSASIQITSAITWKKVPSAPTGLVLTPVDDTYTLAFGNVSGAVSYQVVIVNDSTLEEVSRETIGNGDRITISSLEDGIYRVYACSVDEEGIVSTLSSEYKYLKIGDTSTIDPTVKTPISYYDPVECPADTWGYFNDPERWSKSSADMNEAYLLNGEAVFSYVYKSGSLADARWGVQLFYNNIEVVTGNDYKLTFNFNSNKDGTIYVNEKPFDVVAGDNVIDLTYTADTSKLIIQCPVAFGDGSATVKISNVTWKAVLKGPAGVVVSKVSEGYTVAFANVTGAASYQAVYVNDQTNEEVITESVKNGGLLTAYSNLEAGTYKIYVRSIDEDGNISPNSISFGYITVKTIVVDGTPDSGESSEKNTLPTPTGFVANLSADNLYVTFAWANDSTANATSVKVYVTDTTTSTPVDGLNGCEITNGQTFTLANFFQEGHTYSAYIVALGDGVETTDSAGSGVATFTYTTSSSFSGQLPTPEGFVANISADNLNITFAWAGNTTSNATSVKVYVTDTTTGTAVDGLNGCVVGNGQVFALADFFTVGHTYSAYIVAIGDGVNSTDSAGSGVATFTIPSSEVSGGDQSSESTTLPTPIGLVCTPSADNLNVTIAWTGETTANATCVKLYITDKETGAAVETLNGSVVTNGQVISMASYLTKGHTYSAYIVAIGDGSTTLDSAGSGVVEFTYVDDGTPDSGESGEKTTLATPAGLVANISADNLNVTIAWAGDTTANATCVKLYITDKETGAAVETLNGSVVTNGQVISMASYLTKGHTYSAYIVAIGDGSTTLDSAGSGVVEFTYVDDGTPDSGESGEKTTLATPAGFVANISADKLYVTFAWDGSTTSNASNVKVYVTDTTTSTPVDGLNGCVIANGQTFTLANYFTAGHTYSAYIVALGDGTTTADSAGSGVATFTYPASEVSGEDQSSEVTTLATPAGFVANLSADNLNITFAWANDSTANATSVKVYVTDTTTSTPVVGLNGCEIGNGQVFGIANFFTAGHSYSAYIVAIGNGTTTLDSAGSGVATFTIPSSEGDQSSESNALPTPTGFVANLSADNLYVTFAWGNDSTANATSVKVYVTDTTTSTPVDGLNGCEITNGQTFTLANFFQEGHTYSAYIVALGDGVETSDSAGSGVATFTYTTSSSFSGQLPTPEGFVANISADNLNITFAWAGNTTSNATSVKVYVTDTTTGAAVDGLNGCVVGNGQVFALADFFTVGHSYSAYIVAIGDGVNSTDSAGSGVATFTYSE